MAYMNYDFGKNLKRLRIENELTQEQLGKQLNITKALISAYESNKRTPSIEILVKIATVFCVSIDELLGLKKFKEKEVSIDITGLDKEDVKIVKSLVNHFRRKIV